MSYYQQNKQRRLEYQKLYNIIHAERIKEYQDKYFQENKTQIYNRVKSNKPPKERKPLSKYKVDNLERMLRKKLKHINRIILAENSSKIVTQNKESGITPLRTSPDKYYSKKLLREYQYSLEQIQPFSEFVITPEGFTLSFN
jgi:hypothetical protein